MECSDTTAASPKAQGPSEVGMWEDCKSQWSRRTNMKQSMLHERTAAPMTWKQLWLSSQVMCKMMTLTFKHGSEGAHGSPPLAYVLLTVDGFEREEESISLRICPLVGWTYSNAWPHTHEYMGKSTVLNETKTNKQTNPWSCEDGISEKIGRGT